VTFNIFVAHYDEQRLQNTLIGVPPEIPVSVFSDQKFTTSRQNGGALQIHTRPYKLTWVQKYRFAMTLARRRGERWCGYGHDDGSIEVDDFRKLVRATQTAEANVFAVYANTPHDPCRDVYAYLSVEHFWAVDGHDQNFDFYWADIDLFNRQVALGLVPLTIDAPSIKHNTSRNHRSALGNERIARDLIFEKDKAYYERKAR